MKINIDHIPEENKGGTCYVDAANYFLENTNKNTDLKLVHGLPTGQNAIAGIVYGHAWCEDRDFVYDSNCSNPIPIDLYYFIGKINVAYKYERKEAVNKLLEEANYGPWEQELLDCEY